MNRAQSARQEGSSSELEGIWPQPLPSGQPRSEAPAAAWFALCTVAPGKSGRALLPEPSVGGKCSYIPRDPNVGLGEEHNSALRALLYREQSSQAYVQARPCARHPC